MELDTPETKKRDKYAFPSFPETVDYFFNDVQQNAITWATQGGLVANLMPSEVFSTALSFARRVGFMEALGGEDVVVDEDWERKLDAAVERDEGVREKVRAYCRLLGEQRGGILQRFMEVAWLGMVWDGVGLEGVREVWVGLVGVVPEEMWIGSVQRLSELRNTVLTGTKVEGRMVAARALGLVGSHEALAEDVLKATVEEAVAYAQGSGNASGVEGAKVHGGMLALGYLLARLKLRGRLNVLPKHTVLKAVDAIVNALLEARDQTVLDAAIQSFSEICVFAVVDGEYFENTHSKILTRLSELGKKGKEKAILAIGYFSVVFPSDQTIVDGLLKALFAFHENRQVEVNFATGEAIACVAGGWQCKAIRGKVDLVGYDDTKILDVTNTERLGKVVSMVMGKVSETKPSLRKAVCMWMLSLLEFCGEAKEVKERLGEMQKGFRGYLVDRDRRICIFFWLSCCLGASGR